GDDRAIALPRRPRLITRLRPILATHIHPCNVCTVVILCRLCLPLMRSSQQVALQIAEQKACPTDRQQSVLGPDRNVLFTEPGNLALDELLVLRVNRRKPTPIMLKVACMPVRSSYSRFAGTLYRQQRIIAPCRTVEYRGGML